MSKGTNLLHIFIMLAFALMSTFNAGAQVDGLVHRGDSLYRAYRFGDAVIMFNQALEEARSSSASSSVIPSITSRIRCAENGVGMTRFVRKPEVLGRKMLSLDDFFLYFSVEDQSWRALPNQLDAYEGHKYVRALYAPDWDEILYFSAEDGTGTRSIYMTENQEGIWSIPRKVEEVSSPGVNEIYPMVSPDGRTLYFASDAAGGLGGYDLYFSRWDDLQESWSMPQNMGIPFSSPDDDFLFIDSEDEKFSMFASTRDCPKDSVWVYSLEYDRDPSFYSIDNPDELYSLSRLLSNEETTAVEESTKNQEDIYDVYMSQMDRVRILTDSVDLVVKQVEDLRQKQMSTQLLDKEKLLSSLQKNLETAQEDLRKAELDFLHNGALTGPSDSSVSGSQGFSFTQYDYVKRSLGKDLELELAVPDEKFDYSFRILKEAAFAEDQKLPEGIIYQIQLFGGGRKAMLSELKGLSPVYEHRMSNGMYVYRVGCFATYDEALESIPIVLDLGFQGAHLCAFENGAEISVTKAKTLQDRLKDGFGLYEIVITPDARVLDQSVLDAIRAVAIGKEITRTAKDDGTRVYKVGPFDSKDEAGEMITLIRKLVSGKVECESIN